MPLAVPAASLRLPFRLTDLAERNLTASSHSAHFQRPIHTSPNASFSRAQGLPRSDRQRSGRCFVSDRAFSRWCGAYALPSTPLQLDRPASSTRAHPSAASVIGRYPETFHSILPLLVLLVCFSPGDVLVTQADNLDGAVSAPADRGRMKRLAWQVLSTQLIVSPFGNKITRFDDFVTCFASLTVSFSIFMYIRHVGFW